VHERLRSTAAAGARRRRAQGSSAACRAISARAAFLARAAFRRFIAPNVVCAAGDVAH
jgi:hypothetical protein